MFNVYEWNNNTHQAFKQLLNDAKEEGIKFDRLSCVVLKTCEVLQIPTSVMIKLGRSFIDIVKEEAADLVDTFQLIDSIAETKEEKEARKAYEKVIKDWKLKTEEVTE